MRPSPIMPSCTSRLLSCRKTGSRRDRSAPGRVPHDPRHGLLRERDRPPASCRRRRHQDRPRGARPGGRPARVGRGRSAAEQRIPESRGAARVIRRAAAGCRDHARVDRGRGSGCERPGGSDEPPRGSRPSRGLAQALGLEHVRILNDLEAIASAIPSCCPRTPTCCSRALQRRTARSPSWLPERDSGRPSSRTTGCAFARSHRRAATATSARSTTEQVDLLQWCERRFEHVSYERVCSGIGLPNLYAFLCETGRAASSASVTAALAAASDRTPIICEQALLAEPDPACAAAVALFVRILAQESGNLALRSSRPGGVPRRRSRAPPPPPARPCSLQPTRSGARGVSARCSSESRLARHGRSGRLLGAAARGLEDF